MNSEEKNNKTEVEKHLEQQFQKIEREEELPAELKKEVFDTLDSFTLMADFIDLFTVKFTATEIQLLDDTAPRNIFSLNEEEE